MSDLTIPPFDAWVAAVDEARRGDSLWSVQAYRLSLYAIVCHTADRQANARLRRLPVIDQLMRAVGSISANIAEGYSRASVTDRMRFYGYALGSTREAISWYDLVRPELGGDADARQAILIQIRRLLLTTLRRARQQCGTPMTRDSPPEARREHR